MVFGPKTAELFTAAEVNTVDIYLRTSLHMNYPGYKVCWQEIVSSYEGNSGYGV